MSRETCDFIADASDTEASNQRQKKLNDMQQMNSSYQKNMVELKEDIEVKNIKDIPGYEILVMANQPLTTGPS